MEKEIHINSYSIRKTILFLTISIPVLYGFILVNKYGVNIPIADEYDFLSKFDEISKNGFSFNLIWKMHNEHRMLFPNLIFLLNVYLSGYNVKWLLNFSVICISIAYYSVCWAIIKEKSKNDKCFPFYHIITGFLFFHSCQYENMLWGFQIAWFMIIMFLTLGILWLADSILEKDNIKMSLACLMAMFASFTSLHGLFVWGAFLFMLLCVKVKKYILSKKYLIVLVGTIFSFVIYFWGAANMSSHPEVKPLVDLIKTLLFMLGNIIIREVNGISLLWGIFILAVCVICVIRILLQKEKLRKIQIVALGYMSYAYLALGAIIYGRAGYGIEETVTTSRYTTNTIIVYLSLILLLIDRLMQEKRSITYVLEGIIIGVLFMTNYSHIDDFDAVYQEKSDMLKKAYNYTFYGWPDGDLYAMVRRPDILEKYNLSIYRTGEVRLLEYDKETLFGGMEYAGEHAKTISKNDIQIADGYIYIDGSKAWLFNIESSCLFDAVYLEIDGKVFKCDYDTLRPDVSEVYDNWKIEKCGVGILLKQDRYNVEGENIKILAVDNANRKWYSFEVD